MQDSFPSLTSSLTLMATSMVAMWSTTCLNAMQATLVSIAFATTGKFLDMEIVSLHSHFHNAAINMTTSVLGGEDICTGFPTYKDGFLIETSKCALANGLAAPFQIKKGEHIKVETF